MPLGMRVHDVAWSFGISFGWSGDGGFGVSFWGSIGGAVGHAQYDSRGVTVGSGQFGGDLVQTIKDAVQESLGGGGGDEDEDGEQSGGGDQDGDQDGGQDEDGDQDGTDEDTDTDDDTGGGEIGDYPTDDGTEGVGYTPPDGGGSGKRSGASLLIPPAPKPDPSDPEEGGDGAPSLLPGFVNQMITCGISCVANYSPGEGAAASMTRAVVLTLGVVDPAPPDL